MTETALSQESPFERFVRLLEEGGYSRRFSWGTGSGRYFRCPAHEDRSPSLSVAEGEEGRVLVYCFAGCSAEEVCRALGLELTDLFLPRPDPPPEFANRPGRPPAVVEAAIRLYRYRIDWLAYQSREARLFYLDGDYREQKVRAMYPDVPDWVWEALKEEE